MNRPLLVAALVSSLLAAVGCADEAAEGEGEEGEGEAGEGEGEEGEGEEGEGEEPVFPAVNDFCENATVLVAGTPAVQPEHTAEPTEGNCNGAEDVFFAFTLTEDSQVDLVATADPGALFPVVPTLSLLGETCTFPAAPQSDDRTCVGGDFGAESSEIHINNLAAGLYFVAVESLAGFGFNLELTVGPAVCGDAFDENGDNATAATATPMIVPLGTDGTSPDFGLCPSDVDYLIFSHGGGLLTLTQNGAAAGDLIALDVDGPASVEGGSLVYTEGALVSALPVSADVDRGYYVVKATGAADLPALGASYNVAVTHGCGGDEFDDPIAVIDDAVERAALPPFDLSGDVVEPLARRICGGDIDYVVKNGVEGEWVLSITSDRVEELAVTGRIEREGAPADVLDLTTNIVGSVLTVTWTSPPPPAMFSFDPLIIEITSEATTTLDYSYTLEAPGLF